MRDRFVFSILDAAFDLGSSKSAVLQRIAELAGNIAADGPVAVCIYDETSGLPDLGSSYFERADENYTQTFAQGAQTLPLEMRRSLLTLEPTVIDARSVHVDDFPEPLRVAVRARILLTMMANTGEGGSLSIAFGDPRVHTWSTAVLQHLKAVAHHLAAAWRLRDSLTGGRHSIPVVAELRLDGTATSLSPEVETPSARSALRSAVRTREKARSTQRSADNHALWPALISGRWTLVDAFTAGGTRYVVAYENPPKAPDLRGLSHREQAVLEYTLAGRSGKWIALELKLSEPTIARALHSALRRIGRADLTALAGLRSAIFEMVRIEHAIGRVAVASIAQRNLSLTTLSHAEQEIAAKVIDGKATVAIARERGTSPRTVVQQIANIYRKLEVSSRRELLALFS